MSTTSKSPRTVALVALKVGRRTLPTYAHRFSPKTYTQHQLFACLALKTFFQTDYRGIVAILADCPDLCRVLELEKIPHFTTVQKASQRLLRLAVGRKLLDSSLEVAMGRHKRIELAAMDSTGLESGHVSSYFVKRRSREPDLWQTTQYTRYPKLGIVCDCRSHLILSTMTRRGPTPDVDQFRKTLLPLLGTVKIRHLVADAGYDSESNHEFARDVHGIRTTIPATHGRPTDKLPRGRYRRLMKQRFDEERYGQRWQVETVISMIKRNLGSALRARKYWSQCREMMLLALTHNIMVIRRAHGAFLRSMSG